MINEPHIGLNLDLKSGHPVLEFTNTVSDHASAHPGETLHRYDDLLSWTRQVGLLGEEQVQSLAQKAAQHAAEAVIILTRALELREAIYRIFVAQIRDRYPADADLAVVNSVLAGLTRGAQMVFHRAHFEWQWNLHENMLEAPLELIALAAADLMTSENHRRVGQCADEDGCGWLFVDTSKNHSRRWCDINDCGNRAKQRRHQQRLRRQMPQPKKTDSG